MKPTQSGKGSNHIKIEGDIKDLKTKDSLEGYEYISDLSTEGVQINDPGLGRTLTIRNFQFKINPEVKELPEGQVLFNNHARQIATMLWADGLVPYEVVPPKVIINKEKNIYHIFVTAQANNSNTFIEKAQTLSTHLNDRTRN